MVHFVPKKPLLPFLQGKIIALSSTLLKSLVDSQATFQEAWSYCCGYDMKLLAVESTKKHDCLFRLSKSKELVNVL